MGHRLFRRYPPLFAFIWFLFIVFLSGCTGKIKEPSVAGSFYPADANDLKVMVNVFLTRAETMPENAKLIALISPHAGYQFSGQVAAYSYRHLSERNIKTVIIIGSSHHKVYKGASVYTNGSMKTPLGNVRINEKLAGSLINEKASVSFYPEAFEKEHSLEVQLPFLQQTLKDFSIVPILVGTPSKETFEYLTAKLTELLSRDDRAIIIASTDLSHFHDYDAAVSMDSKMINAIKRMSVEDVERYLMTGEGELCGGYPVMITMAAARALGATNGVLYKYANSGDVTGERNRVVGYAAIGLYRSNLTGEEKEKILYLAKKTINDYVKNNRMPEVHFEDKRLQANGATFVTIKTNGQLRGCIGNIQPVMPLYQSVMQNAVSACSSDSRFLPVTRDELKDIDVEVSVLSPLEPLYDAQNIRIGTDGLYIIKGQNRGLLLPQVASQNNWDRNTFLEQVSLKAGLPTDAWKTSQLYRFTADIIQ